MKDWTGNKRSVYATLGASSHSEGEREQHDYYATDPEAVKIFLRYVKLPPLVWEPAAGGGHIVKAIKECTDSSVITSDKYDHGFKLDFKADFLEMKQAPTGVTCILTNPPYRYATEFVLKSLQLLPSGGDCYMFLRTQFLEGRKRYEEIFKQFPPVKVFQYINRMRTAKNANFDNIGLNAISYAWFWWRKDVYGETGIRWIQA